MEYPLTRSSRLGRRVSLASLALSALLIAACGSSTAGNTPTVTPPAAPSPTATATYSPAATETDTPGPTATPDTRPVLPVTTYQLGASDTVRGMAAGPDGALWYMSFDQGANGVHSATVGRVSMSGMVTRYPLPDPSSAPTAITSGPDGVLWFIDSRGIGGAIGRITTTGAVKEYPLPVAQGQSASQFGGLGAAPDGALYFTWNRQGNVMNQWFIGRITASGAIAKYSIPDSASGLTVGKDGNLWVSLQSAVGRMTTAGVWTEFHCSIELTSITTGHDGNVWFIGFNGDANQDAVGRITTTGAITIYLGPFALGRGNIVFGPDGALWYQSDKGDTVSVERATVTGAFSEYRTVLDGPLAIGPGGKLWAGGNGVVERINI
ncbi:MAG TPA: hypothetical protein VF808_16275 [Ktedonobacterales bacterium]